MELSGRLQMEKNISEIQKKKEKRKIDLDNTKMKYF
jgi:hypothetical protein